MNTHARTKMKGAPKANHTQRRKKYKPPPHNKNIGTQAQANLPWINMKALRGWRGEGESGGHSKKYETKITDNSDGKMGRKEVLTTAAKHSQKIDKATQQHAQPSRTTRKSQRQQRQQGGRTTLSRLTVAAGCPSLRLHGAHSL